MSQGNSSAALRSGRSWAPGKPRIEPVSARCAITRLEVEAARVGDRRPPARRARPASRPPRRRTWRRSSRRCRDPGPRPSCPRCRRSRPSLLHVRRVGAGLADAEEDAAAGRLRAPAHAALGDRLAGHAAERVDVVLRQREVGVGDPGHLLGAGAVVGRRHVDRRTDEALAEELVGVAAGDPFELAVGVVAAVDPDAPLGAAERDLDHRALVGHQRRERHHLVLVDAVVVADPALGRQLVLGVLGAPGMDHLDRAVVLLDRECHVVDAVADPDLLEQAARVLGVGRGLFEVLIDLVEEAQGLGHGLTSVARGTDLLPPRSPAGGRDLASEARGG